MSDTILLVEDDEVQRKMLSSLLVNKIALPVIEAKNGQEALDILAKDKNKEICLVLMDIHMPVMDGIATLEYIQKDHPDMPVIFLTAEEDMKTAIQVMRLGAYDFLRKPPDPTLLHMTIQNALRSYQRTRKGKTSTISATTHNSDTFTFNRLVGHDAGLKSVVEIGEKAAASDIPVLLYGETGVGKEVFARAIHGSSGRAQGPFIPVNCGALPAHLIESTLFGHEKGAFTGATSQVPGRFREADGGTIFLDEIGELPLEAQVKLLRVLQQKVVRPVGANKSIPLNVRIVSATNRNLQNEVVKGHFRQDLYFRLNVFPVTLPPLSERRQDIPDLAKHFIHTFSESEGRYVHNISPEAEKILTEMNWKGNVRELENMMHRAVVLCESSEVTAEDLEMIQMLMNVREGLEQTTAETHEPAISSPTSNPYDDFIPDITEPPQSPHTEDKSQFSFFNDAGNLKTIAEIEKEALSFALEHHKNNVTQAAKSLGIAKSTFYRKLDLKKADNS